MPTQNDPFEWLEDVSGERALSWARSQNEKTLAFLKQKERFPLIESEIRKILLATDRLPIPTLRDGWAYNFWQDKDHVRGIWRRTPVEEYEKQNPQWQTLLDIDALAKKENENWVWAGAHCLPPANERCLVHLSRGGKDASVMREYDLKHLCFVDEGFALPEAKSRTSWKDENTLLVATDFGEGSLTTSGYPRIVKLWTRGTPLSSAMTLLEGNATDVSVGAATEFRSERSYSLIYRSLSFFESEFWVLQQSGTLQKLPLPIDASFQGFFQEQVLISLRSDWKIVHKTFRAGSLVSISLDEIALPMEKLTPQIVYAPDASAALNNSVTTKSALYLAVLQNVQGKVLKVVRDGEVWQTFQVNLPENGVVELISANDFEEELIVQYESFLVPPTLYLIEDPLKPHLLKSLPERFDASQMVTEQFFANSDDGSSIPYFLIHKKQMSSYGDNPTYLGGYGGFQISQTPHYLNQMGKVWLEKGGVVAIANIRGGGEFGPQWHQAALTKNRQKAFDDFATIAKDLIHRKITSAKHLGIRGGSNGGLLVGVAFTQHPELYNAVLCEVPLLDMLRYHKLLAGASWIAEYGDPEDPTMAAFLKAYSPYQNVLRENKYPKVFFYTSTKDDRVHPGHARKMAAKMESQGHPIFYYENIEGGHGGAANLDQQILKSTMQYTYLFEQLFPKHKP